MSTQVIRRATKDFVVVDRDNMFRVGDKIAVHFSIIEGETERVQIYEGIVLLKRGWGVHSSFTVRKISSGVGVERVFPLHSPRIKKIVLLRKGKVRRAKLSYMRKRIGKAAMAIKERF